MQTNFFTRRLKRVLSSMLSVALVVTGVAPASVNAGVPSCTSAFAADRGQLPGCSSVRVGGLPVAYPKLQWEKLDAVALPETPGSTKLVGGDEAVAMANRAARELGLSASDVASAATLFPSNVPYVFARMNPMDATLRIDIYKLEKTTQPDGTKTAGLYHAVFGPSHGDYWKASRAYIDPSSFKSGSVPGVNPFQAFQGSNPEIFQGITMTGAQVAIGHAMRLAGAPLAVFAVAESRMSQRTKKSGNAFRKKVETWTYGHSKPRWFIAQPSHLLDRSTSMQVATMCATDPTRSSCQLFQTATSGVTFEEFSGGTLLSDEDTWTLDYQKKSGLGFLGALVLGVVGSFALAGILAASGVMAGAAAGATAVGSSAGVAMGSFGSFLINQGLITGFTTLGASMAVEAAYVATSMALLGGANLGSVISANPGVMLGFIDTSVGKMSPPGLNRLQGKLNGFVSPRMTGAMEVGAQSLTAVQTTATGNCPPNSPASLCSAAGGFMPRAAQYTEHNLFEFVRDNDPAHGQPGRP